MIQKGLLYRTLWGGGGNLPDRVISGMVWCISFSIYLGFFALARGWEAIIRPLYLIYFALRLLLILYGLLRLPLSEAHS